jgi:Fe-S-cluster-containing dehydrogenase component
MSRLAIDVSRCTACRTCEIACSFHHRKCFDPEIASLSVQSARELPKVTVRVYDASSPSESGKHLPCDGCSDERIPLCQKYCPVRAIELPGRGVR